MSTRAEIDAQVAKVTELNDQLSTESSVLVDMLITTGTELEAAMASRKEMEAQLATCQENVTRLEAELAAAGSSEEIDRLNAEVTRLQTELTTAQESVAVAKDTTITAAVTAVEALRTEP